MLGGRHFDAGLFGWAGGGVAGDVVDSGEVVGEGDGFGGGEGLAALLVLAEDRAGGGGGWEDGDCAEGAGFCEAEEERAGWDSWDVIILLLNEC